MHKQKKIQVEFKQAAQNKSIGKPPKFTVTGANDKKENTYFAITENMEKSGFTTTMSDFVSFCVYNHEPSDIVANLDIAKDIHAKDTSKQVTKEESSGIVDLLHQV